MVLPVKSTSAHSPEAWLLAEKAQKYTKWLATHHVRDFQSRSPATPKALSSTFLSTQEAHCRGRMILAWR